MSAVFDQDGAHFYIEGTERIACQDVSAFWYWRPATTQANEEFDPEIRHYIERESKIFISNLWLMTDHALWFPNPESNRIANNKPYQLMLAQKIGFTIPETVAGNNADDARRLLGRHKKIAIKSLFVGYVTKPLTAPQQVLFQLSKWFAPAQSHEKVPEQLENAVVVYTKQWASEELLAELDRFNCCPVILQEYIPKKVELRITIVGEKVFTCSIDSQSGDRRTREDWRTSDTPLTHEVYRLPTDIEQKCLQLCKKLGLNYGCIDMIVTPEDEYVFLEINPLGQWLWVELETGLPISEAIADLLIAGKTD